MIGEEFLQKEFIMSIVPSLQAVNILAEVYEKFADEKHEYKYIQQNLDQEEFKNDPLVGLATLLIERGEGRRCAGDKVLEYILGDPKIAYKLIQPEFLERYAVTYFKDSPDSERMMRLFKESTEGRDCNSRLWINEPSLMAYAKLMQIFPEIRGDAKVPSRFELSLRE